MYGNRDSGKANNGSRFGKKKSEAEMTSIARQEAIASIALQEAINWTDKLMDLEFRGRGDKEYLIRHRLSQNSGVPESYLYRLQYKSRGMKDVAGEYYRRLKLYYEQACETNEDAADRYKAERLKLKAHHEETDQKPVPAGKGMAVPAVGKANRKKA